MEDHIAEYHRQHQWLLTLIADPTGKRYLEPRDPAEDFGTRSRRLHAFLAHAGRPQEQFRSVHVAGTSGKGSVSALSAALLTACGQRTALHTSPYLQICNEKLQLDGRMISPSDFARITRRLRRLYETWVRPENGLRYDQAWVALTFLWTARMAVDWGVIETGVGGRYDPTNVLDSDLAVITNVALDHMDVLGSTVAEVAHHKAGIVKRGGRVVTAASDGDALAVIRDEVSGQGAELREVSYEVSEDGVLSVHTRNESYTGIRVPLAGTFQKVNAATAITAVAWLAQDFGFDFPRSVIEPALARVRFPGRFEVLQERPTVILDGAHNPDKMRSLAESFGAAYPGRKATVIMGMIAGKSVAATLAPLLAIAREFVFADFQVFGKPSMRAAELQDTLGSLCRGMPCCSETAVADAVRRCLERAAGGDILLVTGSIYFIGLARDVWYPREEMLRRLQESAGQAARPGEM